MLPFRLRSAPKILNAVADAVEWILKEAGVSVVFHYLDDFLLIGAPNSAECAQALSILLQTFQQLGLPIALDKLEDPITWLTFLGLELDFRVLEIRLLASKLADLRCLISFRKHCYRKELEALVGHLVFACKMVRPEKTFLRHIFELLSVRKAAHTWVQLNASFRSDLL